MVVIPMITIAPIPPRGRVKMRGGRVRVRGGPYGALHQVGVD